MEAPVKVTMTLAEFNEFDGDPRPVPVKAGEKAGVNPDIVDNIQLVRSADGGIEMTVIMREPRSQQEAQARGELSGGDVGRNPNMPDAAPTGIQGVPQEVQQFPQTEQPAPEAVAADEEETTRSRQRSRSTKE